MTLMITSLEIERLYGRFDYYLNFENEDQISIITAPNGYGKTAVINVIFAILNRRFEDLSKYRFERVTLRFNDSSVINVKSDAADSFEFVNEPISNFAVETILPDGEAERWEFDVADKISQASRPIERYLPFIARHPHGFFDSIHEEVISYPTLIERYGDELPASYRKGHFDTPILNGLTDQIDCHLIATQRLIRPEIRESRDPRRPRTSQKTTSVVDANASDLASRIASATRLFAAAAQRLDQTFPQRALQQLPSNAPPEKDIRARLGALEARREELSTFGLVEKTETNLLGYQPSLADDAVRNILALYAEDSENKLNTFNSLFAKINLFTTICNQHFSYKKLDVNAEGGMNIFDDFGREIALDALSSGEQHILVLIYELLFRVSEGSLILVDEPELSLHVAWQKRFISDLEKIKTIQSMAIVVATHSPQVINDRWDLEIPLEAQQ